MRRALLALILMLGAGSPACASRQRIRVESRFAQAEMRYVTVGVDGRTRLSPVHRLPAEFDVVTEAPAKKGLIALAVGSGAALTGAGASLVGILGAMGGDRDSGVAVFGAGATLFTTGLVTSIVGLAVAIAESAAEDQAIRVDVHMRAPGVAKRKTSVPLPLERCAYGGSPCLRLRFGPRRVDRPEPEQPAARRPPDATIDRQRRRPFIPGTRTSTEPGRPRLGD